MTQSEIYSLALAGGLTSDRAKIAAAIAMAESKGDPNALNAVPPDLSYGLWQINMLGKLGPERRKAYKLKSNDELFNPAVNTKAMLNISSQGNNWRPWSTYITGAYKPYLSATVVNKNGDPSWVTKIAGLARFAGNPTDLGLRGLGSVAQVDVPNPLGGIEAVGDAALDTAHFVGKTATWISNPRNWVRVAYVTGGSVIVGGALYLVVSSSQTGKMITKTVTRAGKAAASRGASEIP
jgi:Lysozyme like domain